MTTATIAINNIARLGAAHRAFRSGRVDRAYRAAKKAGVVTLASPPDNVWGKVVFRLTGEWHAYDKADQASVVQA